MPPETPSSHRRRGTRPGGRTRPVLRTRSPGERPRLLAAAERIVAENGASALTVESVCALSGVSRAGFRRSFTSRADMLLALHDELAARVSASMGRAYLAQSSWVEGVRAAITDLLATLERNVPLARFMLLDCAIDESPLPARRAQLLDDFAAALDRDRPARELDASDPPFGARALIGAIASILHGRLMEEPVPALTDLAGSLTAMIVLPYMGPDAARTEIARTGAAPSAAPGAAPPPAARSAQRLTQRTLGVLRVIAERPGLSNAQLARASGIADPGQVSRLLARLRSRGLIECEPTSSGRPVGKAWRLSAEGRALLAEVKALS